MAARKRGHAESYKAYRENLKVEDKKLKQRLRGYTLWPGQWGMARKIMELGKPYLTNGVRTVPLNR